MAEAELADFLRGYSGFFPGVAVSVVAAAVLGRWVGRRVGGGWAIGFGLVFAFGLVLSATVTPSHDALFHGVSGSGTCDMSRVWLPSPAELVWPREALLNILLFVPLGAAIGLCPAPRARSLLVVFGLALPFAVELIQREVGRLGRQCQSADVVDNLTGLLVGLAIATALRLLGWAWQRALRGDPAT